MNIRISLTQRGTTLHMEILEQPEYLRSAGRLFVGNATQPLREGVDTPKQMVVACVFPDLSLGCIHLKGSRLEADKNTVVRSFGSNRGTYDAINRYQASMLVATDMNPNSIVLNLDGRKHETQSSLPPGAPRP